MNSTEFNRRKERLLSEHQELTQRTNEKQPVDNGIYSRYAHPILTASHIPLNWRYDFDSDRNPYLMERLGINAVFNAGAILYEGKIKLACRIEGNDRKSFFGIASSDNGIDHFEFDLYPIDLPQGERPDTNVYDMRFTQHEDGWIYGVFCTERKMPDSPESDTSSAEARRQAVSRPPTPTTPATST